MRVAPTATVALAAALLVACEGTPVASLAMPGRADVDAVFAEYDREDSPGCALGVIQDGDFVYRRGYGMANLEHAIALDANSVFRTGSVGKQFTAMVILLLEEAGKLALDDDIRDHLPELPDFGEDITIRHLLHHTSGFRDYLVLMWLAGYRDEDYYTAPELLAMLSRQRDLNFEPGAEFRYSNSGYFLLGQIVERVHGERLAVAAAELIFDPLGMTATHFHDDAAHMVPLRASGYAPAEEGGYVVSMTTLPIVGDGGVFTSVNDLLAWDRNFYDNRLGNGDPALIERWLVRGVLNDGEETRYSAGIVDGTYRGLRLVSHGGAFVGFRADMLRFPEQRFSVIALCNVSEGNPSQLARRVADVFLAEVMQPGEASDESGRGDPDDEEAAYTTLPVSELRRYAGDYVSPELGVRYVLSLESGSLLWRIPGRLESELNAIGVDRMLGWDDDVTFRFLRDSSATVTGFLVDAGRVTDLWFERVR